MKVKFTKRTPIEGRWHEPGTAVDVSDDLGARLVAGGYAESPSVAAPAREPEIETAAAIDTGTVETTAKRHKRRRG